MPESLLAVLTLAAAVFVVATLYSSVGHGGASGYLAVLTLAAVDPRVAAASALVLNVLVAGLAWARFSRAGCFSWPLTWPFLAASVPAAFLGGALRTSDPLLQLLLGVALLWAAGWLAAPHAKADEPAGDCRPPAAVCLSAGAALGLLSGIVGIGGGIFLSPLMALGRWAAVRRIAATSAAFVALNSLAGLAGRATTGLAPTLATAPLVAAALLGGLLGSWLGAHRLTPTALRRVLAAVLVAAAAKMLLRALA